MPRETPKTARGTVASSPTPSPASTVDPGNGLQGDPEVEERAGMRGPNAPKQPEQPDQYDDTAKHPFVAAVGLLLAHLAGEPKSAILQNYYNEVRKEYRTLLHIDDELPTHVQEAMANPAYPVRTAQQEREAATQVAHGSAQPRADAADERRDSTLARR